VLFYGVVCDPLEEAVELFATRREAERVVENWNRDEPDRAGELRVEPIELNIRRTETRSSVRAEALEPSGAACCRPRLQRVAISD
jgi:hypothetical protein